MRAGTRRRLRVFFWILFAGVAAGVGYGGLITVGWGAPLVGAAIGAVHGLSIAVVVGWLEVFATRTRLGRLLEQGPLILTVLVKGFAYSAVVTFAVIFVLQVSRIVGGRTLLDMVLGRYHTPRAEERVFLFVDIVNSTVIAERLGPLAMHRFLGRVFAAAAEPVAEHAGEIYQYVGDEIVVTWPIRDGRITA
jgi:adenylate cyclase